MEDVGGYIKLFRKFSKWEWYDDINTKVLFIHLLISANWKEGKWHGVVVPKGTLITSINKLSVETKLSVKKVRVALNHLKTTNEVAIKTTNTYTAITIIKYSDYQLVDNKVAIDVASKEENEGQGEGKQRATIEELKNLKKEPKDILSCSTIVDYLNLKASSKFKYTTASTHQSINARLEEGYTIGDFKKVIDIKSDEWLGTEMQKYLCPTTLFRPGNFEKYLNQKEVKKKNGTDERTTTKNGRTYDRYGFEIL